MKKNQPELVKYNQQEQGKKKIKDNVLSRQLTAGFCVYMGNSVKNGEQRFAKLKKKKKSRDKCDFCAKSDRWLKEFWEKCPSPSLSMAFGQCQGQCIEEYFMTQCAWSFLTPIKL